MDKLNELVTITYLYDIYKGLLTEKQRMYFEEYYFDNLSLSEIASKYNVSRNAIHSQLLLVNNELSNYENKLKLLEKQEKKNVIIEELTNSLSEIINNDEDKNNLLKIVDKLEEI